MDWFIQWTIKVPSIRIKSKIYLQDWNVKLSLKKNTSSLLLEPLYQEEKNIKDVYTYAKLLNWTKK